MEKIRKSFNKLLRQLLFPTEAPKAHSIYALMENGPMKEGSIGRMILQMLLQAYNTEYEDKADKETLISAMSANYHIEMEAAWQAFLAEIGGPDE